MDGCGEPQLLPIGEALARMRAAVQPVAERETVALAQALDRVLCKPVAAAIDVPGSDNAAMDGYALRAAEAGAPLRLIGTALAGHPFAGIVEPGCCVRIMTGAPVAAGADCVVMQENTRVDGDRVAVAKTPRAGENIRRRGEDIGRGDTVLAAGRRLGPVDIGLLASLGIDRVDVYRRLRVAVLSTGDELTPPGRPLPAGGIYDSNRYALIAMLRRLDAEVVDLGLVRDDADAIAAALRDASARADAVISSGGVSVGDADFVKETLERLGAVDFWKVAIKPGKPFAFGTLGASRFFGLPGNPVSAVVTLHQLALPILRRMAGETVEPPPLLRARAAAPFRKRPGRTDFQRARLDADAGGNLVTDSGAQGSGVLTSFSGANCYAVLEQERDDVTAGETVDVLPFDRYLT